jgi:hypothetical protein
MFKKLVSLLFEEEEVIEEPVEKKEELSRIKKQDEPIRKQPDPLQVEPDPYEKPKRSSFENIVVDDSVKNSAVKSFDPTDRVEPVRPSEPAFVDRKPNPTKDVYEFKPVISPMFGIKESEKEHIRPSFVQTAEVKNDSHLQTVISPYYGAIHKDKKTGPALSKEPASMEPTPFKAKVAEYVEEVKPAIIDNISLEDLIKPKEIKPLLSEPPVEEPAVSGEDVTQFSLFGED